MQTSLIQNNLVTLVGKIISDYSFSHEIYGEIFYRFDLEVPRLSETSDILPITISERLLDKDIFKIGSTIELNGQIRSYNNIVEQKNHLILTVFVKEISLFENDNKNPNEVELNGFLCKQPIYRTTPFGREISDLLIAVNRAYNKSDYIPCIAWGRNAKFTSSLNVGDNIKLNGRMQSRTYQKKLENGEIIEKNAYEISISKLEVIKKEDA